jgi:predicted CopG family antitoxin
MNKGEQMRTVVDDIRKNKRVHVRLDAWTNHEAQKRAKQERKSLSEWIRELIRKAID